MTALLDSLFHINHLSADSESFTASVSFNPDHPIFKGHFPGQPVVPGVCLIEVIRVIMERVTGHTLTMSIASKIKFLNSVDPNQIPVVMISGRYSNDLSSYKAEITIEFEGTVFVKFNGNFTNFTTG